VPRGRLALGYIQEVGGSMIRPYMIGVHDLRQVARRP
jgi:hypothetical protein